MLIGNPTGIANMNTVRHQWAVNIYNTMLANFWIPQTVDMTDDKRTKTSLTKDEERATYDTLGFLIFMDSFQVANLPNIAVFIERRLFLHSTSFIFIVFCPES